MLLSIERSVVGLLVLAPPAATVTAECAVTKSGAPATCLNRSADPSPLMSSPTHIMHSRSSPYSMSWKKRQEIVMASAQAGPRLVSPRGHKWAEQLHSLDPRGRGRAALRPRPARRRRGRRHPPLDPATPPGPRRPAPPPLLTGTRWRGHTGRHGRRILTSRPARAGRPAQPRGPTQPAPSSYSSRGRHRWTLPRELRVIGISRPSRTSPNAPRRSWPRLPVLTQ